jgi:hypothetical protein
MECREYAPHSACRVRITGFHHAVARPVTQNHALQIDMFGYQVGATCFECTTMVYLQTSMFPLVSGASQPPVTRQVSGLYVRIYIHNKKGYTILRHDRDLTHAWD